MKKIFFLLMISIWVTGCSSPVFKSIDYVALNPGINEYKAVALKADHRLVLATKRNKNSAPVICAEPFPEGASESEYFRKVFSDLEGRKTSAEAKDSRIVTLPHPTHEVVKFYRDAVFALCQAAMNNWVGTENKGMHCKNTKDGNASLPFFTKTITTANNGKTTTKKETIACNEFEAQLFNLQDTALEMMRAGAREAEAKLELEKLKRDKKVPKKNNQ